MSVIFHLTLIVGFLGAFNARGMKKIKSKNFNKFSKYSVSNMPKTNAYYMNSPRNPVTQNTISSNNDVIADKKQYSTLNTLGKSPFKKSVFPTEYSSQKFGFFDTFKRGYTTNERSQLPDESSLDNNEYVKERDKFYKKDIKKSLESSYEKGNFLQTYILMSQSYSHQTFLNKELEESLAKKQYDEYSKTRKKEIKDIVENNEHYKKLVDDYQQAINFANDKKASEMAKKFEEIRKDINNEAKYSNYNLYEIQKHAPLNFFEFFFKKYSLLPKSTYDFSGRGSQSDRAIAGRLMQLEEKLQNSANLPAVTASDIATNPYLLTFLGDINYYRYHIPQLKKMFDDACNTFDIPISIEEFINLLKQPMYFNIYDLSLSNNLLQYLFVQTLTKDYLLLRDSGFTAEGFVQFIRILEKMKKDKNFRESVMATLGLNKAEAKYKEVQEDRERREVEKNGTFLQKAAYALKNIFKK